MGQRLTRAVILGLIACAPGCRLPATPAAHRAAVDALRQRIVAAYNAGDAAAAADLWTDDCVAMPQDQPPLVGKEAIRSWYEAVFREHRISMVISSEEVVQAGEWAFDRGTYSASLQPAAGGPPTQISSKYVLIERLQADGSWKIARGISNRNFPSPAAAPATAAAAPTEAAVPAVAASPSPAASPTAAPVPSPTPPPAPRATRTPPR